ncbi:hypothetical protein D3C87_1174240 [compost metagenome]
MVFKKWLASQYYVSGKYKDTVECNEISPLIGGFSGKLVLKIMRFAVNTIFMECC